MIIYSSSPHNGFNLKTAGRTTDVCEGGGTGRRARLRCVWFILGGSNPLPRTRKYPRNVDEKSTFCGFFVVCAYQILPAFAGYFVVRKSRS